MEKLSIGLFLKHWEYFYFHSYPAQKNELPKQAKHSANVKYIIIRITVSGTGTVRYRILW
jgi:hypothetical protein